MAKSLNVCNFIGNLTRDIEIRFGPSGAAIGSGSIACNHSYKNKNTGEVVDEVEYVNLTFFGKSAEIAEKWLSKGSKIHVTGRMKTDKYDDKDGVTKYSTKIIVSDFLMLGGKSMDNENQSRSEPAQQQAAPAQDSMNNDFDSEIPF